MAVKKKPWCFLDLGINKNTCIKQGWYPSLEAMSSLRGIDVFDYRLGLISGIERLKKRYREVINRRYI